MATYTKIDDVTIEGTDLVPIKEKYNISEIKTEIQRLQEQIARLQLIVDEAVKIGVI